MYKIGLSTCGEKITEEKFAGYRDAGIAAMEISENAEGAARLDFAEIRALAEKYGVELWSLHLPFMPFDKIDISNPALAENTVKYCAELIRKGAEIGISKFVLHPSGEPIGEGERRARMDTAKKSLAALAEIALGFGAVIAVENLPRTCLGRNSAEILELISAHEALRVCFDTNHLLSESLSEFIHNVGEKIVTIHVSDYDFVNERHWLPGEGKVNWREIVSALGEISYGGPWLYEIGRACPKTILRERALEYGDFARNARELFAGKEPTVISRPKPNLGRWE